MKRRHYAAKNALNDKTSSGTSRGDTVQSLQRALKLLNALAESGSGLPLSDAARRSGLAVSTAHRLLSTLQHEHFVRFSPESGMWTIGVQSFVVGNAFLRSRDLTSVARPIMLKLMEKSGETVNLAVENRGEAIYIAQIESPMTMRAIARPGGHAALHASGVGKALLSAMPEEQVERIVARRGLPAATGKTITDMRRLKSELEATRERRYAIDDEENAIGLRCVAAVIRDEHAEPIAALSLSGPTARIHDAMLHLLGESVRHAAERIMAALGGVARRTTQ